MWEACDKLRNNMDPAEYKHVVLPLVFLKYISDSFESLYKELQEEEYADPEDRDEYIAENVFWVPPKARWEKIKNSAKRPEIGQIIDDAIIAIENENPELKGIITRSFSRPTLNKRILGELIDVISRTSLKEEDYGAEDVLGRVYEYFLQKFAAKEGKGGGQFYTPTSVVKLLVEMLEPYEGRIYDPCCGSGGMFVQSEKFVKNHHGKLNDISVYGQESNPTTWKLCKMNLAIRGIDNDLGKKPMDSFHHDLHKELKADYVMANPPFNDSDWGANQLKDDVRWKYGIPNERNANYAWIQHFIHHLKPDGMAGFVLANGSLSSNASTDGEIREEIIRKYDLVDCIVALPNKLFYTTGIPASLWFLTRKKDKKGERARNGETLFIDARKMGTLVERAHRELTDEDIDKIATTYHNWKSADNFDQYEDIKGFCKSADLEEIKKHEYILTPGRYVGIEDKETDAEPFDNKMQRLTDELAEQFVKSNKLEDEIRDNLREIGYEF